MTPEQEKKIDALAGKVDSLIDAQRNLTNVVLEHVQTDAANFRDLEKKHSQLEHKAEDRHKRTWSALRRMRDAGEQAVPGMRGKMPSLTAEDSGSFELHALGAGAKFRGPDGIKIGIALLVIALMGAAAYSARALSLRVESAPAADERKSP